ncbi:MAG: hypothetical protein ACFFCQ_17605, partial [Promethearchaeota archaeon]
IFGDIAGMEDFKADHKPYLPLSNTPIITLLPDIIDIIEIFLALSFYIGLILAILTFIRFSTNKMLIREIEAVLDL